MVAPCYTCQLFLNCREGFKMMGSYIQNKNKTEAAKPSDHSFTRAYLVNLSDIGREVCAVQFDPKGISNVTFDIYNNSIISKYLRNYSYCHIKSMKYSTQWAELLASNRTVADGSIMYVY